MGMVQSEYQEQCGFLYGDVRDNGTIVFSTIVQCRNRANDPNREFLIAPEDFANVLLEARCSDRRVALWHSHPRTFPRPSLEDLTLLLQLETIPFIIVGVEQRLIYVYEAIGPTQYRQAGSFHVPI